MNILSREDFEYLSKFMTLEDLIEHKYAKINEYRIERAELTKQLRKLQDKTVISHIEYRKCEYLQSQISECSKMLEKFTHIDQEFIHYFKDRCGNFTPHQLAAHPQVSQ